ncbi:MAG: RelA/SpoT domain-containing protein [Magnetococcus sp. DMHC-6]
MLDNIKIDRILIQYDKSRNLLEDFRQGQLALLRELLKRTTIHIHSLTGTIKDRENIKEILMHPNASYDDLHDIIDLIELHIITHFECDVVKVSDIILREFNVVHAHILDSGPNFDPDRFGYFSRQYTVGMLESRMELIEYQRFRGVRAEIHIRSILQNAWVEIRNKIGYLTIEEYPKEKKRQINQMVYLLEMADRELNEIWAFIEALKSNKEKSKNTKKRHPPSFGLDTSTTKIVDHPETFFEDDVTAADEKFNAEDTDLFAPHSDTEPSEMLNADNPTELVKFSTLSRIEIEQFILNNENIREWDRKISLYYDTRLKFSDSFVEKLSEMMAFLKINNLLIFSKEFESQKSIVFLFGKNILGDPSTNKYEFIYKGVSLYLAICVYAVKNNKGQIVEDLMDKYALLKEDSNKELAVNMQNWFRKNYRDKNIGKF